MADFDKTQIRCLMRQMRKALPREEKAAADASICGRLAVRLRGYPTVAAYLASPDEINLTPLIKDLLKAGTNVVVPRWGGATYRLSRLDGLEPQNLRKGPMGILEPLLCDMVEPVDVSAWIVPGLAFTRGGLRLGYGGGWYDRLLGQASPDAPRIGVAYAFQLLDGLPAEPHDINLTEVVDEK